MQLGIADSADFGQRAPELVTGLLLVCEREVELVLRDCACLEQ